MLVARLRVGESLVGQHQLGRVAGRLEFDRNDRLAFRLAFPRPGIDELLVGHDFPIHAADAMNLAARGVHHDPVAAADADVRGDFGFAEVVARPHPVFYLLGIRPRRVDGGNGGLIDATDLETGFFVDCDFHAWFSLFSRNASRRSRRVFQNSSWRSSQSIAAFSAPPLSWQLTTRPDLLRTMSPASSRILRCLMNPGSDIANGSASSPIERSPRLSLASTARRVGSARAPKTVSSRPVE